MTRRKKEFAERRNELINATTILASMIQQFENSSDIAFLQGVASQLRGLVILEKKSRNFRHPLLLDLTKERGFPLVVYSIDENITNSLVDLLGSFNLEFFSTGDPLSLEKAPPYTVEQTLEDSLVSLHIVVGKERLTIKEVIRLISDTEATHFDPTRPTTLDELDTVHLMGLPSEYRTIYTVGKVVRDLSRNFLETTS